MSDDGGSIPAPSEGMPLDEASVQSAKVKGGKKGSKVASKKIREGGGKVNLRDHDEDLGSAGPCKEAYIPEPSTNLESADFSEEAQATSDGKENKSKPPFVPKTISKKLTKAPKTKETSKNNQPKKPKGGNKLNKGNNGEPLPQPKKAAVPLKASKKDGQSSTSSLTSYENPMLHPPCSLPEPCHCTK